MHPASFRRQFFFLLVLTAGLPFADPLSANPAEWTLRVGAEHHPIAVEETRSGPYLALDSLAEAFGVRTSSPDRKSVRLLAPDGRTLLCQAGRTALLVGEHVHLLTRPVAKGRTGIMVPLEFIEKGLGPLLQRDLHVRANQGAIQVLDDVAPGQGPSWIPEEGRTTLLLPRIAGLPASANFRRVRNGLVMEVPEEMEFPGAPPGGEARVSIERAAMGRRRLHVQPAAGYRAVPLPEDRVVRIALVREEDIQGPEAAPPLKAASNPEPDLTLSADPEAALFRLVVLDPGHGGGETGAVGAGGLQEKDVVLEVSKRLRDLLEAQGIEVAMTRTEDVELPLDDRTAFANQLRADLFVSLHANASTAPGAVGSETFFLSREATDELSRKVAAIESNTLGLKGKGRRRPAAGALEMTLWEMAQSQFLQESQRLADRVQKELNVLAGTPDRGVKQAPLTVLMGATMPAVLVEIGFVSNAAEEAKLQNPAHQQNVAKALLQAILAFGEERRARAGQKVAR